MPLATLWLVGALAALWWLLTDGAASSWTVGIPAILFAVWAARRLGAPEASRLSPGGALAFTLFFIRESVRGGIDVATRTLAPAPRIAPGFYDYAVRLQDPAARLLFVNSVSLLPGTLAAAIADNRLTVHALDIDMDIAAELNKLERAAGKVFREEIQA